MEKYEKLSLGMQNFDFNDKLKLLKSTKKFEKDPFLSCFFASKVTKYFVGKYNRANQKPELYSKIFNNNNNIKFTATGWCYLS
jgi:hypothetical protein